MLNYRQKLTYYWYTFRRTGQKDRIDYTEIGGVKFIVQTDKSKKYQKK